MTKKTTAPDVLEENQYELGRLDEAERIDTDARYTCMELALTHHKINGGMLTVAQLVENAKQIHAYVTGAQE